MTDSTDKKSRQGSSTHKSSKKAFKKCWGTYRKYEDIASIYVLLILIFILTVGAIIYFLPTPFSRTVAMVIVGGIYISLPFLWKQFLLFVAKIAAAKRSKK